MRMHSSRRALATSDDSHPIEEIPKPLIRSRDLSPVLGTDQTSALRSHAGH